MRNACDGFKVSENGNIELFIAIRRYSLGKACPACPVKYMKIYTGLNNHS